MDGAAAIDYLRPELERAVAQAAAKAGFDDGTITVLLDERSSGEVHLSLSTKTVKAEADGRLSRLDQLVQETVGKLRTATDENGGARTRKDKDKPADKDKPEERTTTKVAAALPKTEPRTEPKVEPKNEPKVEPKVDPKTEPKVEPKTDPKTDPKVEPKVEPKTDPKVEPPHDLASPLVNPYPVERRRVVAHAVADSLTTTYPTTGSLATQALYFFLARRLRLQVMPTGFGMVAPAVITDETHRAQAGTGLMAELREINVRPIEGSPPEVKVKLEIVAVRDGKVVFRREIESQPTTGTLVRGRPVDPFYMAVLGALDTVRTDLQAVF